MLRTKLQGKEQSIRIEASSGLSDSEIEKMVNDAKKHEQDDKNKREAIDAANQADQIIYETEKNLKEHGSKFEESEKAEINQKLEALKNAKDSNKAEDINSAVEQLNVAWSAVSAKMQDATPKEKEPNDSASKTSTNKKTNSKKEDELKMLILR